MAVKYQRLYFCRRFSRSASLSELAVDSGLFVWAFHSDCQENLFSSLLPSEPSWQEMQIMGVGFWYTNAAQLRLKVIIRVNFGYLLFSNKMFLVFCSSDWRFSPMNKNMEGEEVFPFPHLPIVLALPVPVLLRVTIGNATAAFSERMGTVI